MNGENIIWQVAKIVTEGNQAKGIMLSDNTIINAKTVISMQMQGRPFLKC